MTQLLQNIDGHIIVIWDRLVAHRSKVVNRWLEKNCRIETEFFPPYAPELNPVEYLWSYLKMNGLANLAATDLEQLYREFKHSLCDIRKQKDILKAFIDHSPVNFFCLRYVYIYAFINNRKVCEEYAVALSLIEKEFE